MHKGKDFPSIDPQISLSKALIEITNKGLGVTAVVNNKKQLNLFKNDNKIIKKLKSINLDKISPIESLNLLNELKTKINDD